jgi:hypothetical protein
VIVVLQFSLPTKRQLPTSFRRIQQRAIRCHFAGIVYPSPDTFLDHLGLWDIVNVSLEIRSPDSFNPEKHEPKLWNTEAAVRRIVAAIDERRPHRKAGGITKFEPNTRPKKWRIPKHALTGSEMAFNKTVAFAT